MSILLQFGLFVACFTVTECSIIYSAQCRSRCRSTYKDRQSLSQCLTPCREKDLHKLGSCYNYCKLFPGDGAPCHFSCKFIKGLYFRGVLPGMCSSIKQPHNVLCSSNRDCSELTKCCYNYCQDLMVKGEEITAAVNNLTSSSLIVHWPESSISNPVYIIQIRILHSTTIYYHEDDWGKWWQIKQAAGITGIRLSNIHPGTRMQFRVAVVNSSGLQSIGPATPMVRTLFNASLPSGPEKIWVVSKTYKQDTVDVNLSWLPPEILDVPVHRYRLSWREIPTFPFHQGEILKEQVRLSGSRLNYTIKRLKKDKNYHVDIQAICLWKKKRLKSPKAALNVSTHNIKGSKQGKIEFNISNISKFGPNQWINSSFAQDKQMEEILVVVEEHREIAKTTSPSPVKVGNHGRNSVNGKGPEVMTTILALLVVYPLVYR